MFATHFGNAFARAKPLSRAWAGHHATQRSVACTAATLSPASAPAPTSPDMFCFQCEQTKGGTGCTSVGVCGKTPETATLQDLLIYQLKGLSSWAHVLRSKGIRDDEVDSFTLRAAFSTLTNVNFDNVAFHEYLAESSRLTKRTMQRALEAAPKQTWPSEKFLPHPAELAPVLDMDNVSEKDLLGLGLLTGIEARKKQLGNDTLLGLQECLMYGLKGMAAYAHHAERLGKTDPEVSGFMHAALAFLSSPDANDAGRVLDMLMQCGKVNLRVMELLNNGHKDLFGTPEPTEVRMAPVEGKAILISGHDILDLENLLRATEGKGINVYTHGELLPAHAYPGIKKYKHLRGNYGGAWYRQKLEFARFPGAILMTTNCILDPTEDYADNLFTTGEVGVSASRHVSGPDFEPVIKHALELPGFSAEDCAEPAPTHTVGFAADTVLGVAGAVIDAMKSGKLKHMFLVGGCDGFEAQRKYYSRLSDTMPKETVVLTLGCAKYRITGQDWGMLGDTGLPRLLDMGQCNDAYSAIVVASELAKALNTDINKLPLSLDISWFEQKAVAVLLTLLSLGVKNIRLGPKLPAFLTPDAIAILQDKFNLMPADTANPAEDLRKMMECH